MNTETSPWHGLRTSLLVLAINLLAACALVAILTLAVATAAHAAGDANQETCEAFGQTESSPGFRSFLPDCRAYELVTPTYAGGAVAQGPQTTYDPSVSPDGNHLLARSFTALDGSENNEQYSSYGALYLFSRSASGWASEALDPPATVYPHAELITGSRDLSSSLWQLDPAKVPGEALNEVDAGEVNKWSIAVREAAGAGKGSFDVLGPDSAPGRVTPAFEGSTQVVAESADLSDVVFQVYSGYKQLWPGDGTREGSSSLYEYRRGMGSEPVLVGVLNEGPLTGSPVNAKAQLASECGIGLGSPGVDMYNAISADGNSVVFTTYPCGEPQVKELYARVGAAKTIRISEPSKEDCALCDTSVPMAAVFQGASEDGSKVFFTSEQELLPGAKGSSLYEYDFNAPAGERVSLVAPDVPAVARVSEDGSRVYFESTHVLTATANGVGESAEAGAYNLYAYDTQTKTPAFVADLLTKGEAEVVPPPPGTCGFDAIECATGVSVADNVRPFDATSDGEFLLFPSVRHLTGSEDTSTVSQLFEYDAATGGLARVSVGAKSATGYECQETGTLEQGYDCNGNTTVGEDAPRMVNTPNYTGEALVSDYASQLSVADDGMVAFESKDRLAPQAVAGSENVYEYRSGNVYVISPGTEAVTIDADGGNLTRLMGTDTSGNDIYFFTTEALVPQDVDSQSSWYDARIGGGFPAPLAAPGCLGDTCQGGLATPLGTGSQPASATATPGENLSPPPVTPVLPLQPKAKPKVKPCKQGFTKRNHRCVRTKAKKSNRRTNR